MKVLFRVDASSEIGTGHVTRCFTLAGAMRVRGVDCTFACRRLPETYASIAASRGFDVVRLDDGEKARSADVHPWLGVAETQDAEDIAVACKGRRFDWIVVDHYALGAEWERRVRPLCDRVLVIDDLADRPHDCDALVDQNLYTNMEDRYSTLTPTGCRLLVGPKFALLRPQFAEARRGARVRSGAVQRLLIFFGGVDAADCTSVAVDAVVQSRLKDIAVDVVIGAAHPNLRELAARCAASGFTLHVQTDRMAELMAHADLAVGAGGVATWERCCLGLPSIVLPVAHNQTALVHDAALEGLIDAPAIDRTDSAALALHLQAMSANPLLRTAMSARGMALVDGVGVDRVLRAIRINMVAVRRAETADASRVLVWRNDPAVRAASRSSDLIDAAAHEAWFAAVLRDPQRHLLIGEVDGRAVGVMRFDLAEAAAEVSIYLAPDAGGRGLGAELLSAAEVWLSQNVAGVERLEAEVLGDNALSHRLFARGGYERVATQYRKRLN